MHDSVEYLVIGGGLAGSMAALQLASTGREVMLLEREREPHHKVCGEFLSLETIQYLQRVGIDPGELGAQVIQRVRLHSGRHTSEAPLPFFAQSLSRYILDEALLRKATSCGCQVRRGVFVSQLRADGEGWGVQLRGCESIYAKTLFLATGKHDLNNTKRGGGFQNDLVGFKMHWKLDPGEMHSLEKTMELFLFRGGYGGLSLVEGGIANLCLVVRRAALCELDGWTQLLQAIRDEVPGVNQRLRNAASCWPKPLAISSIPYGYLARRAERLWRVGDQAAVVPSFTGDGMAIALHSALMAAQMCINGENPSDYLRALRGHLRSRMYFATALSRMMVTSPGRLIAPIALSTELTRWIAETTRIPAQAVRKMSPGSGLCRANTSRMRGDVAQS